MFATAFAFFFINKLYRLIVISKSMWVMNKIWVKSNKRISILENFILILKLNSSIDPYKLESVRIYCLCLLIEYTEYHVFKSYLLVYTILSKYIRTHPHPYPHTLDISNIRIKLNTIQYNTMQLKHFNAIQWNWMNISRK